MYVNGDYSIEAVTEHYQLTAAEVHAAIAYYYDNQKALDIAYEQVLTKIRENAMTLEKFRARLSYRDS
jgi:hypothetical protein